MKYKNVICCCCCCLWLEDTSDVLPGRRGRPNPFDLHLGQWQTLPRTKSHFWLFRRRVRACLRWGHWLCPSGASHRSPGRTWTGKTNKNQNTELAISLQWSPSRWSSGVLTAAWSRTLHRFHPLLTWFWARLSLFSWTEDHQQIDTQTSSSYSRLIQHEVFQLHKVRWQLHSFHFRFSDNLS